MRSSADRDDGDPAMGKWTRRAVIAAVVAVVAIVLTGMHSAWRDCADAGGTTVRGLFWLECIR